MVVVYNKITHAELRELFGEHLPPAVHQILNDGSEDRTIEDVRSELKSLARQIEAADRV